MSSLITVEKASEAAVEVLLGICELTVELFDKEAASRLVGVDQADVDAWLTDGVDTGIRQSLRDSALPINIGQLVEYAWGGRYHGSEGDLDDVIHEALVALPLVQSGPGELINVEGRGAISPDSRQILNRVVDAAIARRTLDSAAYGDINVGTLAALAGVSEKTIRMAANPKNQNALRTTKVGNSTFVMSEDALNWLRRRDGFQETVYNAASNSTPAINSPEALAKALTLLRTRRAISVAEIAAALKWSAEKTAAYEQLEKAIFEAHRIALTPQDMLAVAQLLKVESPAEFARKAYHAMVASFAESMLSGLDEEGVQG